MNNKISLVGLWILEKKIQIKDRIFDTQVSKTLDFEQALLQTLCWFRLNFNKMQMAAESI